MLVLSRKIGESIHVGDTIQVKVVELSGGSVKLGIEAPRDIDVHREEIYRRIQEVNRRASRATRSGLSQVASLWRSAGPASPAAGFPRVDWAARRSLVERAQSGEAPVAELCREASITADTFLAWQEEWFRETKGHGRREVVAPAARPTPDRAKPSPGGAKPARDGATPAEGVGRTWSPPRVAGGRRGPRR